MTENEAIEALRLINTSRVHPFYSWEEMAEVRDIAISALKEVQQYREIGTVEECRKSVKEEDVLKFYYCESEDNYYIGKRVGNFYYARYGETGFEWFMSRYLPWGEHVIAPNTVWKEYTYPSEPKEIPFFEWLQGFIKRYCGGTVEECKEAREKQIPKKPVCKPKPYNESVGFNEEWFCPSCGAYIGYFYEGMDEPEQMEYCNECGQHIARDWSDENEDE